MSDALRICMVAETFEAGVGRHIADLVPALAQRGHAVHLVHSPYRVDEAFRGRLLSVAGVSLEPISIRRAPGIGDARALLRLVGAIERAGPFDLIHGQSSKGGALARLAGLIRRRPVIYTPHAFITASPDLDAARRRIYGTIEAGLARITDRVICVSEAEQAHARMLGIEADRLTVIHNGVAAIAPGAVPDWRRRLPPDAMTIGFVGRFDAQKAPERFVAALAPVLRDRPTAHAVMIGDGVLAPEVDQNIAASGLAERFIRLGAVEARTHLPFFDLLVVTSRYEALAYILLEALVAAVPVVSLRVGGVETAIRPGETGLVVEQEDADGLVRAIAALVDDPARRTAMAAASRRFGARFTIDAMVDAVESAYREAVSRARSSTMGSKDLLSRLRISR